MLLLPGLKLLREARNPRNEKERIDDGRADMMLVRRQKMAARRGKAIISSSLQKHAFSRRAVKFQPEQRMSALHASKA